MSNDRPSFGSGNSNQPKKKKKDLSPITDPNYGYTISVNKTTGKPTKKYVASTQNLNESLGNTQLDGVIRLLRPDLADAGGAAAFGVNVPGGNTKLTANQAMYLFKVADPSVRAQIQAMMYRAGNLYDKKYVPSLGAPLTQQDINAFRKFIIGAASNPAQGPVDQLLQEAADAGDALGGTIKSVYKPLVTEVTNPQDIKNIANKVGQELHGTYLSPEQLKIFTAAYQTMERVAQQQEYEAQGGDVESGYVTPSNAHLADVTKPPDVSSAVADEIRNQNPIQFKANTFTDRLDEVLAGLRGPNPTTAGQVGPL